MFRNLTGEMRQLILSTQFIETKDILFNASRSGSIWRSPLFLRSSWMLTSGRNGRFSEMNGWSRITSDCREKNGIHTYLQTHPNDDTRTTPFDLLLKGVSVPNCQNCPKGSSCNSPGTYESPAGLLVWDIASLKDNWRVPWIPTNSTPFFHRCPRKMACLGVAIDDTFNLTHGWSSSIDREMENQTSAQCRLGTGGPLCAVCLQGYNRVQGSCKKCIPAEERVVYVAVALILLAVLLVMAIRVINKTESKVRYALRDANRIFLICLSLSQIQITVPQVIDIEWPPIILDFLDSFDWVNIDLAAITGATCEASVDFRFTFICMALVPFVVFSLALSSYIRGTRLIKNRIAKLRKTSDQEKRREMLTCYVEIFRLIDCDHSGSISAHEFVDLLKLVGYDNVDGKLTEPVGLRIIHRLTNSTFASSLSMKQFVDGMEKGKVVEVADALLGKRKKRRSSGSKVFDAETKVGWGGTSNSSSNEIKKIKSKNLRRRGSIFTKVSKRGSHNILHNSDAFSFIIWNKHRKLVASSFSWAMQLLMLMHTPISRKVFQYLDCAKIGRGRYVKSFVRADYSILCRDIDGHYDSAYVNFLPFVILVLFGFTLALPFGIVVFLIVQRNNLYSPSVLARIGWLYDRLNRGTEFWEVHEMLRKMILTGVVVFFPQDPAIKSVLALSICICAQVSLSLFRPHRSKTVFLTAQFAYAMALTMYLTGTVLAFANLSLQQRTSIGIFLVVLQSSFVVFGISAIAVSLLTMRSRFKSKRKSLTIAAHVEAAEKRRSNVSKRRSSVDNLLSRLHGVANKVVHDKEALAIMKRHSNTLKQRIHAINRMKTNSSLKVKSRLNKRRQSKRGLRKKVTMTSLETGEVKKVREEVMKRQQSMKERLSKRLSGTALGSGGGVVDANSFAADRERRVSFGINVIGSGY